MGGHRTGDARPVQGIDLLRAPCRVPPLRLAQRGHRPAHTAPARVGLRLFGEQRRLAVPAQPLGLEVFALRLTPGHRLHASARLSGERAPSFPNPRFRPERAGLPLAHLGLERLNPVIPAHRALSLFSRIQLPPGTTCRAPSCPTRGNATAPAPRPPAMAVAKTTNGIAVVFAEFLRLYAAINRRRGLRASPGSRTSAP